MRLRLRGARREALRDDPDRKLLERRPEEERRGGERRRILDDATDELRALRRGGVRKPGTAGASSRMTSSESKGLLCGCCCCCAAILTSRSLAASKFVSSSSADRRARCAIVAEGATVEGAEEGCNALEAKVHRISAMPWPYGDRHVCCWNAQVGLRGCLDDACLGEDIEDIGILYIFLRVIRQYGVGDELICLEVLVVDVLVVLDDLKGHLKSRWCACHARAATARQPRACNAGAGEALDLLQQQVDRELRHVPHDVGCLREAKGAARQGRGEDLRARCHPDGRAEAVRVFSSRSVEELV